MSQSDDSGGSERIITKSLAKPIGLRVFILLSVLSLVYLSRPLHHPISYRMMYFQEITYLVAPILVASIAVFLIPSSVISDWLDKRNSNQRSSRGRYSRTRSVFDVYTKVLVGSIILGVVLMLSLGLVGGMFSGEEVADRTMESGNAIEEFPEVNPDNPRVVPRDVADVQTRGSVSYRQYRLGESDIARTPEGSMAWSYPIETDQFRNRLQGNQQGILLSDMTQMEDREITPYEDHEFKYGTNQFLHRSVDWQLRSTDFHAEYTDDVYGMMYEGDAYMVQPKTGHEWRFTPIPRTVPVWDGVAVVSQDGTIEHLEPEEAQSDERLEGQRLYPLTLSERESNSLRYRNGIQNQLPVIGYYEGVVVPSEMPSGASNSQPFVIDLQEEQMSYVFALEASGSTTRGLDEVWFFDATTGEMEYYESGSETVRGAERAMGLIRGADTRTDWNTRDSSGEFEVVEPVPTFIDGELWWHVKVVPVDNTDVNRNSFVNAHTEEVVELQDTQSVVNFISGVDPEDIEDEDTEAQVQTVDMETFLVIKEDGEEVDRIKIESGSTFEIQFEEITEEVDDETDESNE